MVRITVCGEKILAEKLTGSEYINSSGVHMAKYVDINGIVQAAREEDVSQARNVPADVKECFKKMVQIHKKKEKMKERFEQLRYQYSIDIGKMVNEISKISTSARQILGVLSKEEFILEFKKHIPENVLRVMEEKDFSFDCPMEIPYTERNLYISRCKMIQKYFNGSFVYKEYDGQSFIIDEPEKNKEYQSLLRKHGGTQLPGISRKVGFHECLSMGDKDSLWYSACYEIPLPKDLTVETAKELAAKFFC